MDKRYKYPRTPHLPFSEGATNDDKFISKENLQKLESSKEFVVTEKMDGGNLTFYSDYIHPRSTTSTLGPWDRIAKITWERIRYDLPAGWRFSGESMWAERSIAYTNLSDVFLLFAVWDENNVSQSWEQVEEWAELLSLSTVPVIYRGSSFKDASSIWFKEHDTETSEGFVIRNADSFKFEDFSSNVAKWVRPDHIRTSADWRHRNDFATNGFAIND